MVSQLLPQVAFCYTSLIDMFWELIGACGSRRIWLYAMYMILTYRFILRPLYGGRIGSGDGQSDEADHRKKK